MADIFVKSGMGNVSPYSDWTNAASFIATASGVDSAGDTYYVSATHSELSATTQTIILAGTLTNPNRILCVTDDTVASPTNLVSTPSALILTSGASSISVQGSGYFYGITFSAGTGTATNPFITLGASDGANQVYENCSFYIGNTAAGNRIAIGSGTYGVEANVVLRECTFKFANTGQGFNLTGTCTLSIIGGGIDQTSSSITELFKTVANQPYIEMRGVDLTRMSTSSSLVLSPLVAVGSIRFINCSLPTGWSGVPVTTVSNANMRVSLYNCYTSLVKYRLWVVTSAGRIRDDITVIKNGGSTDLTVPVSWSLVTNASANETINPLVTDPMPRWVDSTGTSKTVTIDFIHDSSTALNNSQIWMELDYLDNTDNHLKTITNKRSGVLTTATAHPVSTASWNSSPLVSPNKQKLEVTFTPQSIGLVYIRVYLAIPNYTVYMDYSPTIA